MALPIDRACPPWIVKHVLDRAPDGLVVYAIRDSATEALAGAPAAALKLLELPTDAPASAPAVFHASLSIMKEVCGPSPRHGARARTHVGAGAIARERALSHRSRCDASRSESLYTRMSCLSTMVSTRRAALCSCVAGLA
jgi:hypothetical protein